ncbi:hypothetical protein [Pseudonocardia alni]|uniref:hypothetical protein n=1 Tax=Pseudonocardia alni TaxID=33907 RepID=UPI00280AEF4D|nr:hypothetical protein [Pseudonocardia alni]
MPKEQLHDPAEVAASVELGRLLGELRHAAGYRSAENLHGTGRLYFSVPTLKNYEKQKWIDRRSDVLAAILDAIDPPDEGRRRAWDLFRASDPKLPTIREGWITRAHAAGSRAWPMAGFLPERAEVHPAIGEASDPAGLSALPIYVPRTHDGDLHAQVAAAAAGRLQTLILLRGTSSTGKTRSLYEAVRQHCQDWMVLRPGSAAAARALPDSGLLDRPVVVWLNELQRFLGPDGTGLSADVLDDFFASARYPIVVVGTLWPDKALSPDDSTHSEAVQLLKPGHRLLTIAVPDDLNREEHAAATERSPADPRLKRALADTRFGFTQSLAGAWELLNHYETSPLPARLLLEAAGDARRVGYSGPLPLDMLLAMARALWAEETRGQSPDLNFDGVALTVASKRIRAQDTGVRALIPVDHSVTALSSDRLQMFDLADFLEQHLRRVRVTRAFTCAQWEAATSYQLYPEPRVVQRAIASGHPRCARLLTYAPIRHVHSTYRNAATAGHQEALTLLAQWQHEQGADLDTIAQTCREAAATGHSHALFRLAEWQHERGMALDTIEQTCREAAAAGYPYALLNLARWQHEQGVALDTIAQTCREAAAAGQPYALLDLAEWQHERGVALDTIAQTCRGAAATGDARNALARLARWQHEQGVALDTIEQTYRDLAAAGHPSALLRLAICQHEQGADLDTIAQTCREAAATGHLFALVYLARRQHQRGVALDTVEQTYRDAAAAGYPDALIDLAEWQHEQGIALDTIAQTYREAAAAGQPYALLELARWQHEQGVALDIIAQTCREAAVTGNREALLELARWQHEHGVALDTIEQTYRKAATGSPRALAYLARWQHEQGVALDTIAQTYREAAAGRPDILLELARWQHEHGVALDTIEQTCREAAAAGRPDILLRLAQWQREQGVALDTIEQTYRDAAAAGRPEAIPELARWHGEQGRESEAGRLKRYGFECGPD